MDRFQTAASGEMSQWTSSSDVTATAGDVATRYALDDAADLIQLLGNEAFVTVAAGATTQFGEWLGWPEWFKHNTEVATEVKIPERITLADDLIIIANIVDHGKSSGILSRLTADFRIPGAPITVPALYNAPTLLDALQFFLRTSAFGSPFLKIDFTERGDQFSIRIDSELRKGDLRNFCASAMLAVAYRFVTFFVIEDAHQIEIDLEAQQYSDITVAFARLPGRIRYQADCFALHGKTEWLQLSNGRTDKAFWNFALERMTVAEREGNKSDLVQRIRAAVCATMENEGRVPRLKQIAAAEGVSERTLVRALALQGIRFQQIVEEERRLKASELIGNASNSLSEIAKMLGFTDMSSFGRSYRQWFGVTPGQARARRGN